MTHPTSVLTSTNLTSVQLPTTVGLDLSDRVSHFHVMRGDGVTLSTGKVATERAELAALFIRWKGCRLACTDSGKCLCRMKLSGWRRQLCWANTPA